METVRSPEQAYNRLKVVVSAYTTDGVPDEMLYKATGELIADGMRDCGFINIEHQVERRSAFEYQCIEVFCFVWGWYPNTLTVEQAKQMLSAKLGIEIREQEIRIVE